GASTPSRSGRPSWTCRRTGRSTPPADEPRSAGVRSGPPPRPLLLLPVPARFGRRPVSTRPAGLHGDRSAVATRPRRGGPTEPGASMSDRDRIPVILAGSARTPIGRFLGGLAPLRAPELGAIAVRAAVERAGIDPAEVDDVVMGHVVTAGAGQAPARQAAIGGGIPATVPAVTVN